MTDFNFVAFLHFYMDFVEVLTQFSLRLQSEDLDISNQDEVV